MSFSDDMSKFLAFQPNSDWSGQARLTPQAGFAGVVSCCPQLLLLEAGFQLPEHSQSLSMRSITAATVSPITGDGRCFSGGVCQQPQLATDTFGARSGQVVETSTISPIMGRAKPNDYQFSLSTFNNWNSEHKGNGKPQLHSRPTPGLPPSSARRWPRSDQRPRLKPGTEDEGGTTGS